MRIRQGRPQDARLIAEGIVMAITPETCLEAFGHPGITIEDVTEVFEALAARPCTQYSYLNTLVAEDEATGQPMGLIVSYDGAELHELREQFVKEAEERLGWKAPTPCPMRQMPQRCISTPWPYGHNGAAEAWAKLCSKRQPSWPSVCAASQPDCS